MKHFIRAINIIIIYCSRMITSAGHTKIVKNLRQKNYCYFPNGLLSRMFAFNFDFNSTCSYRPTKIAGQS